MTDKNRPWGVHTIHDICGNGSCFSGLPDGRYVRAVPEPYTGNRIVAAWWVFMGRARAIIWPTSAEFAAALGMPERKPWPSEGDRAKTAAEASAHLPKPDAFKVIHFSKEDLVAVKAAYKKRFNEDLPRTETMMCVASIGYRMALRDLAQQQS